MLQIRFILAFVVIGAAYCAGVDVQTPLTVAGAATHKRTPAIVSRRYDDFNVDDDYRRRLQTAEQCTYAPQLCAAIEGQEYMNFSDVERIAKTIYTCKGRTNIWVKITNAVCMSKTIEVDFVQRRFVSGKNIVQPKERVEIAIARIVRKGFFSSKRDLTLMLYSLGYRYVSLVNIHHKLLALIGAGFCHIADEPNVLHQRMRSFWNAVKFLSPEEEVEYYHGMQEHSQPVFQMIYMKRHGIIDALKKIVMQDDVQQFAFERHHSDAVLQFLEERKDRPCKLHTLAFGTASYAPTRGVFYDLANLMFYDGVHLTYDNRYNTCQIGLDDDLPKGGDEPIELVLFRNVCASKSEQLAILETYKQGYKDYSPAKLRVIKRAFDIVGFFHPILDNRHQAVYDFLSKHREIPNIWDWDAHWVKEGGALLALYNYSELQALFDMHNSGILRCLYAHANRMIPKSFFPVELFSDDCLCTSQPSATISSPQGEMAECSESVFMVAPKILRKPLNKDGVDADEVSRILAGIDAKDKFEKAQIATCILQNRHPYMALDAISAALATSGVCTYAQVRDISEALTVVGLVPREKECEGTRKRRAFFHMGKTNKQFFLQMNDVPIRGEPISKRDQHVVTLALNMDSNPQLKHYAKNTVAVPSVKACVKPAYLQKRIYMKPITSAAKPLDQVKGAPRSSEKNQTRTSKSYSDEELQKAALQYLADMGVEKDDEDGRLVAVCLFKNLYPKISSEDLSGILTGEGWNITYSRVRKIFSALNIAELIKNTANLESPLVKNCRELFKQAKENGGRRQEGAILGHGHELILGLAISMDKNARLKDIAFGTSAELKERIIYSDCIAKGQDVSLELDNDCFIVEESAGTTEQQEASKEQQGASFIVEESADITEQQEASKGPQEDCSIVEGVGTIEQTGILMEPQEEPCSQWQGKNCNDVYLIKSSLQYLKDMGVERNTEGALVAICLFKNLYPRMIPEAMTEIIAMGGWEVEPRHIEDFLRALYVAGFVNNAEDLETPSMKESREVFKKIKTFKGARVFAASDEHTLNIALSLDKNAKLKQIAVGTSADLKAKILHVDRIANELEALPQKDKACQDERPRKRVHFADDLVGEKDVRPCKKVRFSEDLVEEEDVRPSYFRDGGGIEALLAAARYIEEGLQTEKEPKRVKRKRRKRSRP